MSNFTFFHKIFKAIWILKSFNSHISVIVCSFFEFENGVLGNALKKSFNCNLSLILQVPVNGSIVIMIQISGYLDVIAEPKQLCQSHCKKLGVRLQPRSIRKLWIFCCVYVCELEHQLCYHVVQSSISWSGCQLWNCIVVHRFGLSTGVFSTKWYWERLV